MFITDLMQKVDELVQSYTFDAYSTLVASHINSIRLVVVLYFIFMGYRIFMAKEHFSHVELIQKILTVSCCYYIATNWGVYSLFIYDLAIAIPNSISIALVLVAPNIPNHASGVELLEYLWFSGLDIAATLFGSISISAIHQGLMALGVLTMTLLLVGYGLLVITLAKMIMAIGLALAPLFVLLFMFNGSRSLFVGWLRVIFTAMMKQIIIFAMIALVYCILFNTTETMLAKQTLDMMDVSTFLLLMFISLGMFLSASRIASTIGESLYLETNYYANKLKKIL